MNRFFGLLALQRVSGAFERAIASSPEGALKKRSDVAADAFGANQARAFGVLVFLAEDASDFLYSFADRAPASSLFARWVLLPRRGSGPALRPAPGFWFFLLCHDGFALQCSNHMELLIGLGTIEFLCFVAGFALGGLLFFGIAKGLYKSSKD